MACLLLSKVSIIAKRELFAEFFAVIAAVLVAPEPECSVLRIAGTANLSSSKLDRSVRKGEEYLYHSQTFFPSSE
jgi:hypothetical protein